MKTKLVPFDIEKAKNGAKLVTRSGLSARRVDVDDVNNGHPVLCLVTWKNGIETPILYSIDGRYYPDHEDNMDLFIEEEVEETDDYNPYKTAVEVLANIVKIYAGADSDGLRDFYNEVKAKCREAVEYDHIWCKSQDEKPADNIKPKFKVGDIMRTLEEAKDDITGGLPVIVSIDNVSYHCNNETIYIKDQDDYEYPPMNRFEIMPDKWYLCTREACLWLNNRRNYTSFMEGVSYLGSDILKCDLSFEHEFYQKYYFRPWTIQDAKPGDVLVCIGKYGQEIGIVKKYVGKYGGCDKCFETYCFVDWEGIFRLGEYMGSKEIYPATKERRDFLFQKMKEAGYEWNSDKKELHKIEEVKKRRMTNQELSWWLRDCPEEHREWSQQRGEYSCEDERYVQSGYYDYFDDDANVKVDDNILIRRNGGEWQEPLIED